MENTRYAQQGDVLLFEINNIPPEAKHLKNETTLHYGATGNHHRLSGGAFGIYEYDGRKYLEVAEETRLSHEEHKAFFIAPARYELRIVQEKDHFNDLVRPVVD